MSSFFRLGGSKADANDSADAAATDTPSTKASEAHPLDALTGGAFSAATSGERAARIREWLASQPSAEQMQEVFKELSAKDKGAAKPLREKLDELKRARNQEAIAAEWAARAQALLDQAKLNIADAMAWQRDAAVTQPRFSDGNLGPILAYTAARDDRARGERAQASGP